MPKLRAVHTAKVRALLSHFSLIALALSACTSEDTACPPLDASAIESVTAQAALYRYPLVLGPDGAFEAFMLDQDHGLLIDRWPMLRGPHDYTAILRTPSCELSALAQREARPNPAFARREFGAAQSQAIGRALLLYNDPLDYEARHYERIGSRLAFFGHSLLNPPLAEAETALQALLTETPPGGAALLVLAGEGSTPASGLALGLSEQLTLQRLSQHLRTEANHLGLLILIADLPQGHQLASLGLPPQTILISASSLESPYPPRLGPQREGALGPALLSRIQAVAHERCIPPNLFDQGELHLWLEAASLGLRDALSEVLSTPLPTPLPQSLFRPARTIPKPQGCQEQIDCARRELLTPGCGQECHRLVCLEGQCLPQVDTFGTCDDGNACTTEDHCTALGTCEGTRLHCESDKACHSAHCDPQVGCVETLSAGESCDDEDPCTFYDVCSDTGTCEGQVFGCDDGNPCTEDSCAINTAGEAVCVHKPREGLACDDGDLCTLGDQCRAGVCQGSPKPCADGNACTVDACDSQTGQCHSIPTADFVSCDDGNACTLGDRCEAGLCVGSAKACDDGLACTFDRCLGNGQCEHLPMPGYCLDGQGCVAVGEALSTNPCQMCSQTNLVIANPEAEGSLCGESDLSCREFRCEAGTCRERIATDSCLSPEGDCVAQGQALTPCLVCEGGGRARATVGQPCEAQGEGCGQGTCDAYGNCGWSDSSCCDTYELSCGELIRIPASELYADYPNWSLGQGLWSSPGPDRWLSFQSPCAGRITIRSLSAGALFAVPSSQCGVQPGEAITIISQVQRFSPGPGERIDLVLEAQPSHAFVDLSVECLCNP